VDTDLKKYADSLYDSARAESARTLRDARVKDAEERASRNPENFPTGIDVHIALKIFDEHIERCMVARLNSYGEAYDQTLRIPSEQDFTEILKDCEAVQSLEIRHAATAITRVCSRNLPQPGLDVLQMMKVRAAHGHDRVLQKWKVWKAKAQLKPSTANVASPEKRRDALLPIYDRAEFDRDVLERVSKGSDAAPVALVFMDLDKFKSINDGPGGHQAGDRALKAFSEAVLGVSGGKGDAYRYGGDELCILLPNYTINEAAAVAERLRSAVQAIRTDELTNGLSTSIGVACFPESTPDASQLVSQADQAMYNSKKAGGNCVTSANSAPKPNLAQR
jgi:diguanylate cyclase (GGDEF)-like protein